MLSTLSYTPGVVRPVDVEMNFGGFDSTTITVMPVSEKGQAWFDEYFGAGLGVASITIRKSAGFAALESLQLAGLRSVSI